tara:strand:+ start:1837 stop:2157 length:321 start_codon:yes stop_codon:yes gene_type:complete
MGDAMWATRKDSRNIYIYIYYWFSVLDDYFLTAGIYLVAILGIIDGLSIDRIARGLHTQKSKNRALARVQHYSLSRRVDLLVVVYVLVYMTIIETILFTWYLPRIW